ncbi:28S rRNA (cytosine-C(5))-methyltransferase-like [Dreissena polymorpha]|nr:28S rRNA (cytosine-C(5))-methyltransferase-like [Dreissena polymorpha]XP_052274520.1 28S rRNA (cytosine-C(5))-methyltransferase-like [Dreissena polymorpha]
MDVYVEASRILQTVLSKKASIKTQVYSSSLQNKKALYAVVCEVLKNAPILKQIAGKCEGFLRDKQLKHDEHLALVLLYEHMFGRGVRGRFKVIIARHKTGLHAVCERLKIEAGVSDLKQLLTNTQPEDTLPKYVRINTLKSDLTTVKKAFEAKYKFQSMDLQDFSPQCLRAILHPGTVIEDPHISNVLVFPSGTDLHTHPLYLNGSIILQDKASCFPAHVLSPHPGSMVIDCCAAPGNKTTHLAAILNNKGKVLAFDKDPKRLDILKKMVGKAGATCVIPRCLDFLRTDPQDAQFKDVEYILVDPSCSGSGMLQRTDENSTTSVERLQQLSKFQISILKHALRFPAVRRVVYSTCSIHEMENEQVVEEVISQVSDRFEIGHVMPHWPVRGLDTYQHGSLCVRMSPDKTLTNGFFVACFERRNKLSIKKSWQTHAGDDMVKNNAMDLSIEDKIKNMDFEIGDNVVGVHERYVNGKVNGKQKSMVMTFKHIKDSTSVSCCLPSAIRSTTMWTVSANIQPELAKKSACRKKRQKYKHRRKE